MSVASATSVARVLVCHHRIARPAIDSTAPTRRPSVTDMRLAAIGRDLVRSMSASVSRSATWLSAAAPPATSAVPAQVMTMAIQSRGSRSPM